MKLRYVITLAVFLLKSTRQTFKLLLLELRRDTVSKKGGLLRSGQYDKLYAKVKDVPHFASSRAAQEAEAALQRQLPANFVAW